MSPAAVCRVCLAAGVSLLSIKGALQLVYEKITGIPLHSQDKKPVVACYICHAQLRRCHKLIVTSSKAENMLNYILHNHSKITVQSVSAFDRRANGLCWALTATKPECYQNLTPILAVVKTEPVAKDTESEDEFPHPPHVADLDIKCEFDEEPSPTHQTTRDVDVQRDVEGVNTMVDIPGVNDKCGVDFGGPSSQSGGDVVMDTETVGGKVTLPPDTMVDIPDVKSECDIDEDSTPERGVVTTDFDVENVSKKGFPQPICLADIKSDPEEDPLKCADVDITQKETEDAQPISEIHISASADEKHSQQKNKPAQRCKCNICKRQFSTPRHLKIHLKTHGDEKPYVCKVCSARFKRKDMLIRHTRTHDNVKPYSCIICRKQFKRAEHLKRHVKTHDSNKKYECSICKTNLKGAEIIMKHIRSHSSEKHYECDGCGRSFRQKSNLVRHCRTHMDDKHKCNFCQRWFKHSNNLSRHLKTQHWGDTC